MRRTLLSTLVLCILTFPVFAQDQSPEDVARQLSEAYRDDDLGKAASLMHPDALKQLQSFTVQVSTLDSTGTAANAFAGVDSAEDAQELSPEEAFIRFMEAVINMRPEIKKTMSTMSADVLGHVMEGDSLAHVISRNHMTVMGADMSTMEVISMKRHDGTWKALLSADIRNFVTMMRARFGQGME